MAQPILTYNINWGTNNIYQKLSGKTYVDNTGKTVDCSNISITFSSSVHFQKFYATAVKDGKDYGFINDILVDIQGSSPTGIKLYELADRNANTNFTFTINSNSFKDGDGQYRIGLYLQNDEGEWNYEYLLISSDSKQLISNDNYNLQVPVVTT